VEGQTKSGTALAGAEYISDITIIRYYAIENCSRSDDTNLGPNLFLDPEQVMIQGCSASHLSSNDFPQSNYTWLKHASEEPEKVVV